MEPGPGRRLPAHVDADRPAHRQSGDRPLHRHARASPLLQDGPTRDHATADDARGASRWPFRHQGVPRHDAGQRSHAAPDAERGRRGVAAGL